MAEPVLMPKQGQSVESCIITEWYKSKGDNVSAGELLFAYETDKASFEEEAQSDGILLDIFFNEGDEVPVLTNVAVIGVEGESAEPFRPGKMQAEGAPESSSSKAGDAGSSVSNSKNDSANNADSDSRNSQTGSAVAQGSHPAPSDRNGRVIISPRARKLADTHNIPFEILPGSGPHGRIIVRDIEAAIEKGISGPSAGKTSTAAHTATAADAPAFSRETNTAAAPVDYEAMKTAGTAAYGDGFEDVKLSNMRKLIAKSMYASLQNSAQLTHHLGADARKILQLRKKVKALQREGYPHNITLNDMVSYATIRALLKNPDANVHFLGDAVRKFEKVHFGLAVDTERGLMVAALRNASDLSLEGLSSQLKSLADSCRNGNIDPDLLASTAASFTLSNLGNYGVEMFTPIINIPQAAILGVNTIVHRPAPLDDGTIGFVPYIGLSLTYDHRALDGGPATKFLAGIKDEIEHFNTDLL
jgi:pyruvate dehydrogenase E2 component (dihydrolipoamide acetyltransferase)